jgi:hypothetical protein
MQMPVSEPENLSEDSAKSEDEWTIQETVSKRQQSFNEAMHVILEFH